MKEFLLQLDWPEAMVIIVGLCAVSYLLNVFIRGLVGGLDGVVYIERPCDRKHVESI
jgi:hypothetical protein